MKKALLYTLVFLVIQVVATTIATAVITLIVKNPTAQHATTMQIVGMSLSSLTAIALFLWLRWAEVSKSYMRSRPWMVLFWSCMAAIGSIVPSLLLQEMMPEWPAAIESYVREAEVQTIRLLGTQAGYVVVCLLVPVAEELVFRGAILRALLAWKPQQRWTMIALSALIFAVVHLNPDQMPHAFLAGLLLGWMYMRTHSVVPGVVFHLVNNTASYVLVRLYPAPDIRLTDILGGSSRSVLMAAVFSLLILLPALFQLNVWMKKARKD